MEKKLFFPVRERIENLDSRECMRIRRDSVKTEDNILLAIKLDVERLRLLLKSKL